MQRERGLRCRPARALWRVGGAGSTLGCEDCLEEAGTSGAHRCRSAWLPEKLGPASLLRRSPQSRPAAIIRSPLSSKVAGRLCGHPS